MRPSYFALFLTLVLVIWQSRGFAQSPAAPVPTTTHPAATALLDRCIKSLSRSEGLEVNFVQTIQGASEPATISGRAITLDKQRARIEINFKQVQRQAELKLLCDGTTFCRIESLGDQQSLTMYTLKELQETLERLATNETDRVAKEDVEKEQLGMHGFEGIAAMVKDLKTRMVFGEPSATTINLPGKPRHPVKMIEGQWTNEVVDLIAPPKKGSDPNQQDMRLLWNEKQYFFMVPRKARLYFDAASQQLLKQELLGITEQKGPEKVLTYLDIVSITPLTTVDIKLFQPTEAELKYKRNTIDLATEVRNRHQTSLNIMKLQQQMQK